MLQGLWIAHIVSAFAKLQIPDLVAAGPQSGLELAQKTGADPHCLYRLLRTAAALGLLTEDGEGRFRPSALSDLLRSEATPSLQGIATFFSDPWHTRAWEHLLEVVRTGRPAMDLVYGVSAVRVLRPASGTGLTFLPRHDKFLEPGRSRGGRGLRFHPLRRSVMSAAGTAYSLL
jgi:Dimerisation domain